MTRSRVRFFMLALIAFGTVVNYLDRSVLGIAAPLLRKELGIDAALMGVVFSAFSWTYAAAQIPGGILLDRFGSRIVYFFAVALWSAATFFQGTIHSLNTLLGLRLALGVAEAPAYPTNSRVVRAWFPQSERARANGVYSVGQYFGLAFLSPLLFWIAATMGWRMLFLLAGAIGLVFSFIWLRLYREPHESKRVNQAELDYIKAGGGLEQASAAAAPFSWRTLGRIAARRQVIGASLGQFCSNSTLVFFLTWFPTYLATERHLQMQTVGLIAVMPYIAASVGVLVGGWASDFIIKKTGSATLGRKLPVIVGLLMATTIVAANYVATNVAVVAIMSFVFFGQGMCNLGWTVITDVAPKGYIGLTAGIFNLCANLAGIIAPIVIGVIVGKTGSFVGALTFMGSLALAGVFCYAFILGDVKRLEIDTA
jgi:ACS family D-galactonate transporter-like MFS transporter